MSADDPNGRVLSTDRLEALRETGLLDALPQASLDRYTRLATRSIGAPVALVSLVDPRRQFFASALGLPEPWASRRETPLTHSFCKLVVASGQPLIVSDAEKDARVAENLAVSELGVRAYAGMPIRTADDHVLGSFCVIDSAPRAWTEHELALLDDLCDAVIDEVELRRQAARARSSEHTLSRLNQTLQNATEAASVRARQLVHDVRTPLSVLSLGVHALRSHAGVLQYPEVRALLDRMDRNTRHTASLVAEMTTRAPEGLTDVLEVCSQLALDLSTPTRVIRFQRELDTALVALDDTALRRCVENLLSNAQRFARASIVLSVVGDGPRVRIAVDDDGPGLPDGEAYGRVWEEGQRYHEREGLSGSGLGLSIVREIVEAAHGSVSGGPSPVGGAQFVITLPRAE